MTGLRRCAAAGRSAASSCSIDRIRHCERSEAISRDKPAVIARHAKRAEAISRRTCGSRLLRRCAPRKKLLWEVLLELVASGDLCGGLKVDGKAERGELGHETLGFEFGWAAVEVVCAEIVVWDTVFEHMIDRGEERGGDGADGLLRPAFALYSEELGSVVTAFFPLGRPGALDEHGLEPRCALAQTRGFALACALVVTRAQADPRDQVSGGREAAHIATDLGENRRCRHGAYSRGRVEKVHQVAKGRRVGLDLRIHLSDPLIDLEIDLA